HHCLRSSLPSQRSRHRRDAHSFPTRRSSDLWDDSFRKVYQHHIDRGVQMIMAGHIAHPAYSKKLNPSLEDKDILPATLSSELITDRKSTRLNSSHVSISYAVFCLKTKKTLRA